MTTNGRFVRVGARDLTESLRRIEQNAILRAPKRVSDLIRGDDTDSVRVIISDTARRPSSPGNREGLSLSRRSLYRLFRNGQNNLGWYWDGADDEPWKPLTGTAEVNRTYVVCLRPLLRHTTTDWDCVSALQETRRVPIERSRPAQAGRPIVLSRGRIMLGASRRKRKGGWRRRRLRYRFGFRWISSAIRVGSRCDVGGGSSLRAAT